MPSNSSYNRVRSVVVHLLMQVVISLTQLSELNSIVLVVTVRYTSEISSEINNN